jgi:hypothetical protein
VLVVGWANGAAPARAEGLFERDDVPEPSETLYQRIASHLTDLSDGLNLHLHTLSLDLVDMRLDFRARRVHLRLGGGDHRRFALRLDGDVMFQRSGARVHARVELALAGHRMTLQLPAFDMVPRSYEGERYVEVRVPLIEGRF